MKKVVGYTLKSNETKKESFASVAKVQIIIGCKISGAISVKTVTLESHCVAAL
jgi:hypothetical protein